MELNQKLNQLSGSVELDIENQSYFIDRINSILNQPERSIIVNLENVTYIDSSGLWALFEGHKKATMMAKRMVLVNPTKDVRRVLDITKMSTKLDIFTSEKDALKELL